MKKKTTTLLVKWKNNFDALLFRTLFAKIRKTETNIKRIDRFKKTISFLLLQIIIISLFCIFGIKETKQLTYADTILITGKINDYWHIDLRGGKNNPHYYNLWIDGEKCRLLVNDTTCKEIQAIIHNQDTIELHIHNRILVNEVAEFYFNNTEYASLIKYNKSLSTLRILAIIIFSTIEIIINVSYVLYIIFHRTSKDKKWI